MSHSAPLRLSLRRRGVRALAGVLALALGITLIPTAAAIAADGDEDQSLIQIQKTVSAPASGILQPGDSVSYSIQINCSSVNGNGCTDAVLTDPVPAPLVLQPASITVAGGGYPAPLNQSSGNTLQLAFQDPLDGGATGMAYGRSATVTFSAQLPADVSADVDGIAIVNTATYAASNASNSPQTSSAPVTPQVATTLQAGIDKQAAPASVVGIAGTAESFTIRAWNASNRSVDALVVQDAADGAAQNPFALAALTGIGTLTPPQGADRVQLDWRDAAGVWHTGSPTAIPSDPDTLLAGLTLPDVQGVRFAFTSSTGELPPSASAQGAVIELDTALRSAIGGITADTRIDDVAQAAVRLGGDTSPVVTDQAGVDVVLAKLGPIVEKSFLPAAVNAGQSTTATVHAENGDYPIVTMTVNEPKAGQLDLVQQGLDFQGFAAAELEWPNGATGATIQYAYEDGFVEGPKTAAAVDTLPAATTGHRVTGFQVVFTGDIAAHAYAQLPFAAIADPVSVDTTLTNEVDSTIVTASGASGTVKAVADLTRRPVRVNPTVDKTITPGELYGVAGSNLRADLPATVKATELPDGSTIGAERLTVSDPAAPTGTVDEFWDAMDLAYIPNVAVPNNANLAVEYWDGTAWQTLPGAGAIAGPAVWSTTIPAADRAAIQGIRFVFTPKTAGDLLPPGFSVEPHLGFVVRAELRSEPGTPVVVNAPGGVDVTKTNTVRATTENASALPSVTTADADDDIVLHPLYGGGPDPDLLEKGWVVDGTVDYEGVATVPSRTQDQLTARLSWTTAGLPFDQVVLSEPATPEPLADSFMDAFDIVQVKPITTALDPALRFDAVVGVQRYSLAAHDWIDAEGSPCTTAAPCDGTFPGYTVPTAVRDDTAGVRLVIVESPTRASRITGAGDPQVGSGVASSTGSRGLELVFQVRDTLRSDPSAAVVGSRVYNLATAGLVENTAGLVGTMPDDSTVEDEDSIDVGLIDLPLNVSTTKSWDQDVIGLPQAGTAQADYPVATATVTATNETAAKVNELVVQDPDPTPSVPGGVPVGSSTFDVFDLWAIRSITVPAGATATQVVLHHVTGPDTTLGVAAATAIAPGDPAFADVVGITVRHTGRIASGASTTIVLDFQLRAVNRTTGDPVAQADTAINTDRATVVDPGGTADDHNEDWAADSIATAQPSYAVTTLKGITPAERMENDGNRSVNVSITARPDRDPDQPGTAAVRTRLLTITDTTPTFWNAYDFTGLRPITVPQPVQQVKVDALVGVDYSLVGGELVATCDGDADLGDCWQEGVWQTVSAGPFTPAMPAGVNAADVRGLRWSYQRTDGGNWERPYNPTLPAIFTADRRDMLRYGTGGATDTPVPSTLPTLAPAPGETDKGTTTNTVETHADGAWGDPASGGLPWTADAHAPGKTVLRHLQNSVKVEKAPADAVTPGLDIDYTLTVTNDGAWPMTGLTVTDVVQGDAEGPLMSPAVRDVGDTTPVYGATLTGPGGATLTPPTVTPHETVNPAPNGMTIAFELPDDFVLQPGQVLKLTVAMWYRGDLAAGTPADNSVTVDSDRIFDRCTDTVNRNWQTPTANVETCTATTRVHSLPASPISVIKGVKGDGGGVLGAQPGDPNYDDLGVLAYNGAAVSSCTTPNGLDADGFYRYPCVPITRPGGDEQWRVWLTNNGNIPAQTLSAIDVLPANDDRAVIIDQPRSSRWAPAFLGNIAFTGLGGAQVDVYYLDDAPPTVCNRLDILRETKPGGVGPGDVNPSLGETAACLTDIANRDWQLYDESMTAEEKADIAALKVVVTYPEGQGLAPSQTATMTYDSETAAYPEVAETTDRDSIAWNSIAVASLGMQANPGGGYTPQVSLVGEARKTGVAMATGKIQLAKDVVTPAGWSYPLPSSYQFQLQCTSDGVEVPLVGVNGESLGTVTVPGDGTPLVVNNGINSGNAGYNDWSHLSLPLYADCSIVEVPAQGAEVSYDPTSAVALRDFATRADVADPAWPRAVPLNTLRATNAYDFAGFRVWKTVDVGGATDQDGTPIARSGPYDFTALCEFRGDTVLNESFQLRDGEHYEQDGLPSGSSCTVTESATAGGAGLATTTIETTSGGDTASVTGKTATLTLAPDTATGAIDNVLDVENAYAAGAIEIRKDVTGAGADDWGDTTFQVRLSCTLATATPSTVFDDVFPISKAAPVVEVTGIAAGATCAVTEPSRGGADTSSVSPASLVVDADATGAQVVTVTNTFLTGTVRVTKALTGAPAAALAGAVDQEYVFAIDCVRTIDGTDVPIPAADIPGGATRRITGAGSADWTGLPVGAQCTVQETDGGHATSTTVAPAGGVVTVASGAPEVVTVTNDFANGAVEVTKSVVGDGAAFAPAVFTATVTCTWYGVPVALPGGGVVTLTDGGSATLSPVPVGSVCSVVEADAGQSLTASTPVPVTVGAGAATELPIVNTYELASLEVTKDVVSAASPVPTGFGFHATCTFLGTTVLDEDFLLDDAGRRTFTGLPARSDCDIVETDARDADSTIAGGTSDDGDVTLDQPTRTVHIAELTADAAGAAGVARSTATFQNLYGVASLVVTKALAGGAADRGLGQPFPVRVVCEYAGETLLDETVVLTGGTAPSHSWTSLVAGADCTITETDTGEADAAVITPNDGTTTTVGHVVVAAGATADVAVTNWFLTGSVAVTKYFEGDGAAKFGTREYPVRLDCTVDGAPLALPSEGIALLDATAPTTVYTGLPTGAACTVAELDDGGATSTRIVDATAAGADGPQLAPSTGTGYDFTIDTTGAPLSDADKPQMPLGLVNHYDLATLSVTKTVDGGGAVDAAGDPVGYGPFGVTLDCLLDGEPVTAAEAMHRTIADGETATWTELPVGARCTITEDDTAGAASVELTPTQDGATGTTAVATSLALAPLSGAAAGDSVALRNVFATADLTVRKAIAGTQPDRAAGPYPIELDCVLVDASHPAPGLQIRRITGSIGGPDGLVLAETDLPAGTSCTVTETDAGTADRTTITVDGGDPTEGRTATVVLQAGTGAPVEIVVTNVFDAPLASTGVNSTLLVIWLLDGLVLVGLGVLAIVVVRRRRS